MIYISPLSAFENVMETASPSHAISLLSPEIMIDADRRLSPETHLRLSFNDINTKKEGLVAPDSSHVHELIQFVKDWSTTEPENRKPLYIHCYAGIARSPAAGYIAMCLLNPGMDEENLAQMLRSVNRSVTPNSMMIDLADEILNRKGRMVAAIKRIGRGEDAWEGDVFHLPIMFQKPLAYEDKIR